MNLNGLIQALLSLFDVVHDARLRNLCVIYYALYRDSKGLGAQLSSASLLPSSIIQSSPSPPHFRSSSMCCSAIRGHQANLLEIKSWIAIPTVSASLSPAISYMVLKLKRLRW
jgi:hypothetical protein